MSNIEQIKELRNLTNASMKACKDAIEETSGDLQKAVDLIKTKGQNITSANNKVAAEGLVIANHIKNEQTLSIVELNCNTDFVAKSPEFLALCNTASKSLGLGADLGIPWRPECDVILEGARKNLMSSTKENIVIRRWYIEQLSVDNGKVFSYVHPNGNAGKIAVALTMIADNKDVVNSEDFNQLGNDIAMQIAALSPLAISSERLPPDELERQRNILEEQVKALNKPVAAQAKILEGKLNKWFSEVCLLDQESVIVPKATIRQVVEGVGKKLGVEITLVNFIRAQVGEGIEKKQDNFADDVIRMVGV